MSEKKLEKLLSGKMARLNYWELTELLFQFPENINTLMIQKTSDCFCVMVDDITVRKAQEEKKEESLLKIARAIEREYGCGGCPYEDRCFVKTDAECIGRITMWLESVTE